MSEVLPYRLSYGRAVVSCRDCSLTISCILSVISDHLENERKDEDSKARQNAMLFCVVRVATCIQSDSAPSFPCSQERGTAQYLGFFGFTSTNSLLG